MNKNIADAEIFDTIVTPSVAVTPSIAVTPSADATLTPSTPPSPPSSPPVDPAYFDWCFGPRS